MSQGIAQPSDLSAGHLTRRAGVVSFFTLLSRILGACRDMTLLHVFGATGVMDTFTIAFTIPNVFRRLVAEGALTIAFVPVYSEVRERLGPQQARRFTDATFTLLVAMVGIAVVLGCLFAAPLVTLFASGFRSNPEQFELAVRLTRWMFPYLLLVSCVSLSMGLLNASDHFAAPAAAPIVLNVAIIGGAILSWRAETPILAVAVGVLVGGVAQLLLQLPPLIRRGVLPRPSLDLRQEAVFKLARLMTPALFGLAVYQVNIIVLRNFGSYLPSGQLTCYYAADRLMELALGVFAIAVATAALPSISAMAARADLAGVKAVFGDSVRLTNYITIPAAVGLITCAVPIVAVLFQHGAFTRRETAVTAAALVAFAPGLAGAAVVRLVTQTFYSLGDARKPVQVATATLFFNAALGALLVSTHGVVGLAATLSVSTSAQALLLLIQLWRRVGALGLRVLLRAALRNGVAACAMGVLTWSASKAIDWQTAPQAATRIGALAALLLGGAAIYFTVDALLGGRDGHNVVAALRRRA